MKTTSRQLAEVNRSGNRLVLPVVLLLLAACATPHTVVNHIWHDPARTETALGKTLVLAFSINPTAELGHRYENAWVSELRQRGIDAYAWHQLAPGAHVPQRGEVAAVVRQLGFETVLAVRVVALKKVERETAASQVAVVETALYGGRSRQAYWRAESETYLISHTGEEIRQPPDSVIREYVEIISRALSQDGFL